MRETTPPVATVDGLCIRTAAGGLDVLQDVSLSVAPGEVLGLVGETGCGKTTLGLALLGYARAGLRFADGAVSVAGHDLLAADASELRALRGSVVSYVPQDASTALNPGLRLGQQFNEVLAAHGALGREERQERVADVLHQVDLPADVAFLHRYPHQLSGGQQQRIAIALSFVCRPSLVIMDEPTTGLDVATQLKVLEAVDRLRREDNAAVLLVSHDLSMLCAHADRLAVMYAGSIVEMAAVRSVARGPRHPYTFGLFEAIPDPTGGRALVGIPGRSPAPDERESGCTFALRCPHACPPCREARPELRLLSPGHLARCVRAEEIAFAPPPAAPSRRRSGEQGKPSTVLEGRELVARHGGRIVLDHVSVELGAGSCLALVGESGSGKTTLARCLVGLHGGFEGRVLYGGQQLRARARSRPKEMRRATQYVFQNPYSSLNPRRTVLAIVAQPLQVFFGQRAQEARTEVTEALARVGLGEEYLRRYPHELSGGERQRVALARALVARPSVLICDEVTSSLDVSVQAVTVNLLHDLQQESGLAMLFITHNLPLVRSIADEVMVLRGGKVVEVGAADQLFARPSDPYTRSLLSLGALPTDGS